MPCLDGSMRRHSWLSPQAKILVAPDTAWPAIGHFADQESKGPEIPERSMRVKGNLRCRDRQTLVNVKPHEIRQILSDCSRKIIEEERREPNPRVPKVCLTAVPSVSCPCKVLAHRQWNPRFTHSVLHSAAPPNKNTTNKAVKTKTIAPMDAFWYILWRASWASSRPMAHLRRQNNQHTKCKKRPKYRTNPLGINSLAPTASPSQQHQINGLYRNRKSDATAV